MKTQRTVENKLLLSPQETAEKLAISIRKLWSMKSSGDIPYLRIGRSVRFALSDLHEWIEQQKQGGRK